MSLRSGHLVIAAVMLGTMPTFLWAMDEVPIFNLGQVRVLTDDDLALQTEISLPLWKVSSRHLDRLASTLATLPGVNLSVNARNENEVYVRGFNAQQVPIYVDGIPLTSPYEGYVDLGRFSTFDLAEVRVAKGAASVLYGPNTLGGAINLISRKPVKELEGDFRVGIGTNGLRKGAINIGSKHQTWYAQFGASAQHLDGFALPKGFKDYKRIPTDTGRYRANADEKNHRVSFKVGLTPHANDEYVLGYSRLDAEKGNPVYTGRSEDGIRFWRWPEWDKETVYLLSNTQINDNNFLKTRWYYDEQVTQADAYKNDHYDQVLVNKNFPSRVKDRSVGLSLEWVNDTFSDHSLHTALHLRQDKHKEQDGKSPLKKYKDHSVSIALEDTWSFAPYWQLRTGLSHDRMKTKYADHFESSSNHATNAVIELSKQLDAYDALIYGALSYKTRFPTLKDRYFNRRGQGLTNPNLQPETARHLELGLQTSPWSNGVLQTSVFYSRLHNVIESVNTPAPSKTACGGNRFCAQNQNIGKARHLGFEMAIDQALGSQFELNAAYQYIAQRNLTDKFMRLTHVPRHRLITELVWKPHSTLSLSTAVELESGRWVPISGSGRNAFRSLSGFGDINLNAAWQPHKQWRLDGGVNNMANKWYELADGYPMPGRTWYLNATYSF